MLASTAAAFDDQHQPVKLVVIGAGSRAGKAIMAAATSTQVVGVSRSADKLGVSVSDYRSVPDGIIDSRSIVVNCVGSPIGTEDHLLRLNRDVAFRWAEAAAAAKARQFVQLSSFSVYGRAETIDIDTPEQPITAYGRSKLAGENALLALQSDSLAITIMRIPLLFGDGQDKLRQLVRAAKILGVVPAVSPPIARSMISYAALAAAVQAVVSARVRGVVNVVDPAPFSYELLREHIGLATGNRPHRLPLPRIASALAKWVSPSIHAQLLASSFVERRAQFHFAIPDDATITAEIERIARGER